MAGLVLLIRGLEAGFESQNRTEQNRILYTVCISLPDIPHQKSRELSLHVVRHCVPGAVNVEGQTSVNYKNWHTAVRLSRDDPQLHFYYFVDECPVICDEKTRNSQSVLVNL